MDLVSIIIPTYNCEKFIGEAIKSVQNQTYRNWEIILVDDASTDNTLAIITKFSESDNRIKINQLDKNSGNGFARNVALQNASGRYIAFLDGDDLWSSSKLEKQIAFLKTHQLPFTFSFYDCIDEEGNNLYRRVEAPLDLSYNQLFYCNYIGNLTAIYDTDFFGKIKIEATQKRQDWRLWLTILKQIKTTKPIPESLAFYRIRKDSMSSSKFKLIRHNFSVYREFHGHNLVFSILLMTRFLFTQLAVKPRYIKAK